MEVFGVQTHKAISFTTTAGTLVPTPDEEGDTNEKSQNVRRNQPKSPSFFGHRCHECCRRPAWHFRSGKGTGRHIPIDWCKRKQAWYERIVRPAQANQFRTAECWLRRGGSSQWACGSSVAWLAV